MYSAIYKYKLIALYTSNLVPRVLSYPPSLSLCRVGRREPWERGCGLRCCQKTLLKMDTFRTDFVWQNFTEWNLEMLSNCDLRLGLKIISELEIQVLVSLMTNLHFLQWRQDVSYLGCWTICLHVGGVCYRFLSPLSCNYLKTLKQNPKIGEWGGVGEGGRRGQLSHINQINFVEICSFSNKTNWLLTYSTWFLSDVQMSLSSVLAPFGFIYSLIFCRLFFTVL